MNRTLFFSLVVLLASCGSKTNTPKGPEKEPEQKQEEKATTSIAPETEITAENAKQVTSFDNTPESVVMYFYASKIRKDNEWEKVCQPADKRTDKMKRKLEKYESWTFNKYRFVSKKEFEPNKFWIKLHMAITIEGESDEGDDEATVEMIDGKWIITEVPT